MSQILPLRLRGSAPALPSGAPRLDVIQVRGRRPGDLRVRIPRKGRQGTTPTSVFVHRLLG